MLKMECAYCGSTSTRRQETFTIHGNAGVEEMPTDFGKLDSLPSKINQLKKKRGNDA
jgi:sarcosine oxidase delta subunit